ncbi:MULTISPECIES: ATP-dependent DNA helicase RecG [Dictyoglomus]|uniref:ATP-dependent DNA helicase RecG n=1 Tax=Dictyoglomus turgidum (strain DSM 6724 / Z-1310) TaxID=515635 RepID=B8E2R9_DICTD|nr:MULTISPECIES: ATP-dependent DNA helicase RecG [Dictyoglomus]ACK42419.1 ATP-dependent DNA helicase RecG [Dictyoglomus turgidum DSM 6724]HBU32125.1 DNA helicase RecG [Dictyoglomus sp.]
MPTEIKLLKGLKNILENEISSNFSDKSIKYGLEKALAVALKQFPLWNGFWTQKVLDLIKDYSKRTYEERAQAVVRIKDIIERAIEFYTDENFWEKSVQFAKGVGPHRAKLLNRLEIHTIYDLITYYPRDYDDRSKLKKISEIKPGERVTIKVKIIDYEETKTLYKKIPIIKAKISDNTGWAYAVWYGQKYIKQVLPPGTELLISGEAKRLLKHIEFENPEYETLDEGEDKEFLNVGRIVPIYSLTSGLTQKVLRKIIYDALTDYSIFLEDPLPKYLREKYNLMDKPVSVWEKHFPTSFLTMASASKRITFEELFFLQLNLAKKRREIEELSAPVFNIQSELVEKFLGSLPFKLTKAQEKVWEEIKKDLSSGRPMHRLLQGDVGSGKTVIAALATILAYDNGYQTAFMVPTEILAEQHYNRLKNIFEPLGIKIALLTSSTPKKEKTYIYLDLAEGKLPVVIGTHALIQEEVTFKKLGLVIIDEQHRFGVIQRAKLWKKGEAPHLLVMTATPIPRSLALVLYGELDISIIDELPPGRKPVITYLFSKKERRKVYSFVEKEIEKGKQAFVVCPLIEESEKLEAESAKKLYEELKKFFPRFNIGLIHGLVPREERTRIMEEFQKGEIQILVATTVIEVGVDIPNASIMVIENADRFGLAQLHQLRGRVGRGSEQSYCFLIADLKGENAKERLKVMVETNDGFVIANKDLEIRGPGEFFGTKQHGTLDVLFVDLTKDMKLFEIARNEAFEVIKNQNERIEEYEKVLLNKWLNKYLRGELKEIVL